MKYCDQCGAKLRDAAKFCDECGNKLDYKVETAGVQTSCNDSFINNTNTIDLNVEDNTFIATAKYGQGLKYESFWNDVPCKRSGYVNQKQVREYKGEVYYFGKDNCITGKHNSGELLILAKIDKENLTILKQLPKDRSYLDAKSGYHVSEATFYDCFSIFDDKIFYAKIQEAYCAGKDTEDIFRIAIIAHDISTGKETIAGTIPLENIEGTVYQILHNSKKELICIFDAIGNDGYLQDYVCNLNTRKIKKINKTEILGYNENYCYYKDRVDDEVILKVMDLDTLRIANLSEQLTNIKKLESEEFSAEFYMIDVARDKILYSVNNRHNDNENVSIYAVDLNNNCWKESGFVYKYNYRGIKECLIYNGEYWIYTIHPETVNVGQHFGFECYDKAGNRIDGYYKRKEEDFLFDGQGVVLVLPHVFCSMWGGKDAVTKQEVWTRPARGSAWLFNYNFFYLEGDDDVDSNVVIRAGKTSFYYQG